jgi:hypothetical protein
MDCAIAEDDLISSRGSKPCDSSTTGASGGLSARNRLCRAIRGPSRATRLKSRPDWIFHRCDEIQSAASLHRKGEILQSCGIQAMELGDSNPRPPGCDPGCAAAKYGWFAGILLGIGELRVAKFIRNLRGLARVLPREGAAWQNSVRDRRGFTSLRCRCGPRYRERPSRCRRRARGAFRRGPAPRSRADPS